MTQTGWATTADVLSLTGATPGQPIVDQANAQIEVAAGRIYTDAVTHTGTRDQEWMRRAVCYQAAWIPSQPDIYGRLELEAVSATGRPVPIVPTALTLAPLAKRALNRVSWVRSRSLHVRSPFADGPGPISTAIMDYDDDGGW